MVSLGVSHRYPRNFMALPAELEPWRSGNVWRSANPPSPLGCALANTNWAKPLAKVALDVPLGWKTWRNLYKWLKWWQGLDQTGGFYMALWFGCVVFWPVALLQIWLRTSSFDGNFSEFCIVPFRERSTKHWTSRQHTLWPSNRSVLADYRVEISAPQIAYVSSSKDLHGEAGSKYLSWILVCILCSRIKWGTNMWLSQ